jgi:RecB family endonuclease NucS
MQISEKDFEDWVVEHIGLFLGDERARVLCRQVRLPDGGIMDVLATVPDTPSGAVIYLIELKRDTINEAALTQLLAYKGVFETYVLDGSERPGETWYTVRGIVAAPAITEQAEKCLLGLDVEFIQLKVTVAARRDLDFRLSTYNQGDACTLSMLVKEAVFDVLIPESSWPNGGLRTDNGGAPSDG